MTVLLILVNCWVFFAWQMPEENAVWRMARVYAGTPLPAIEGPAYARDLRARADRTGTWRSQKIADQAERMVKDKSWPRLYESMWHDQDFRRRLLSDQIIRPGNADYTAWREARADFSPREPQPFTLHWSQDFDPDAPDRLITWLTSTFLHGGMGHLLGNMVFLFLFGFTLEAALGPLLYLACYLVGGIGASALAAWAYAGTGGYGLGASGAISALMGMYVVLYGLKRIPFFYMVLFYFNFACWPAVVVLPVWMLYELAQHLTGRSGVGNMAHLGGLIAGGLLMGGLKLVRRFDDPALKVSRAAGREDPGADETELARLGAQARQLTDRLAFAEAARVWQQAARLAPRDPEVLDAWLACARHDPASESFHAAARQIFGLPAHDAQTRQLLHRAWRLYLATAKPSVRLRPVDMQALVRAFVVGQEWQDAENLARALSRMNPPPRGWTQTVQQLASGLARAGRMEQARAWLPQLQRHAPGDELTRWLAMTLADPAKMRQK
jgi:membrane associated rhomboid family serine protease